MFGDRHHRVAVAVNAFANLVAHARERHIRWHPRWSLLPPDWLAPSPAR